MSLHCISFVTLHEWLQTHDFCIFCIPGCFVMWSSVYKPLSSTCDKCPGLPLTVYCCPVHWSQFMSVSGYTYLTFANAYQCPKCPQPYILGYTMTQSRSLLILGQPHLSRDSPTCPNWNCLQCHRSQVPNVSSCKTFAVQYPIRLQCCMLGLQYQC